MPTNNWKIHDFSFNLPGAVSHWDDSNKIEMDGKPLLGVSGLCVKAGPNGYTNVVIEFEAPCAIEFAGRLIAHAPGLTHEDQVLQLSEIFRDVNDEIHAELKRYGANLMEEHMAQADFVRRIIELTIERVK